MKQYTYEGKRLTTAHGLLYADGEMVSLPLADTVANAHGFVYVERLVKHLELQRDPK